MPKMTSYRHGVPAWIDVSSPDVEATAGFYCGLFGWDLSDDMGPEAGGYRMFFKDGALVAGIGPSNEGPPAWTTYVKVDDIDEVSGRIAALGGTLAVAPMDLPNDSGRIGYGIDPTGGFFAMFQPGANHQGSQVVNEPGALAWNELNVRDAKTAIAFYDALFGWTTEPMDDTGGYFLAKVSGRAIAGVLPMNDMFPPEVPTNWLPYFAVDDAHKAAERCAATGGGVHAAPFDTPVGVMAVLHDPTGAVFAVGAFREIDDPNNWPS